MTLPAVYLATTTNKYYLLRDEIASWSDRIHFTCRWPFTVSHFDETNPSHMTMAWRNNVEDIHQASWLVCIAPESYYHLRGALVEVGMALDQGCRVVLVGEHESFGSWQHHPSVVAKVPTLEAAFEHILNPQDTWAAGTKPPYDPTLPPWANVAPRPPLSTTLDDHIPF